MAEKRKTATDNGDGDRPANRQRPPDGPERYGRFYWCVKVPKSVSHNGEIFAHADRAEITPSGTLQLISTKPPWWWKDYKGDEPYDDQPGEQRTLALAPGSWLAVFAASVYDGHAIAVEHWKGEAAERR
jgi:hypothetical protein